MHRKGAVSAFEVRLRSFGVDGRSVGVEEPHIDDADKWVVCVEEHHMDWPQMLKLSSM